MQHLDPKSVWIFFFNTVAFGLSMVIWVPIVLVAMLSDGEGDILMTVLIIAIAALVLYVVAAWFWAKLTYHFYKYELREDGFRKEHGVIWKKYVTIPYDRIQNVDIHRGILARLLGLSDLQIQTAGAITAGSYGAFSEGRLPGLPRQVAEEMRDDLVSRTRGARSQGL